MTFATETSSIVVGVDGSIGAARALRWAAAESELHGAELTAVMVWAYLDQHHVNVGDAFDPTYGEDEALEALEVYITAALGAESAERVRARVVCDLPARGLLEASANANLLVMGARGLGGFKGLLLGSVSQRCLHRATTPVAVIRESPEQHRPGDDRVVVAVDGSGTSRRALHWALEEGRLRKATVDVVNAWQMPSIGYNPATSVPTFDASGQQAVSQRILDDALAEEDLSQLEGRVRRLSLRGGPSSVILEVAKDADLLVVGSRGLGRVDRILLGSVATQMSLHASCPVVVVPARRDD